MTIAAVDEILSSALRQPERERARIATLLIASLDASVDRENDSAWEQEIDKRLHEIDTGAVTCIPWEEVRKQLYRNAHVRR
ncbi:MAG: putative addiction module component, TIGR02574 family [Candidatus Kentron sp. G]|nr:MAG: putative addiction module component, TIGR02574 family [Candidatus Kentron sp. G]VFN07641.1 MAG: putative addiction module component, TIGR02574 family [Candidatus Kentron sp. G]VFN08080.1 MAG: putative addiction module component, TIGR02574 family [Candidatus Kentron sp. G]